MREVTLPQQLSLSDNLGTQVLSELKQDILSGFYPPGSKLRMAQLKETYKVGVSPLREALSQLLAEQLVEVENQRGFRVSPISLADMEDIYEARAHIEALCVGFAIDRGDDAWEAGILAAEHRLKKSGSLTEHINHNLHEWEVRHHDFHSAIVAGCQSPTLLQVRNALYEKAARYRNLWLKHNRINTLAYDANAQEHDTLVNALLKRDKITAAKVIQQHFLGPVQVLRANWF